MEKPNGLTVISKENEKLIHGLPVDKLWGIGRRLRNRLSAMGIFTIKDLINSSSEVLRKEFGINGIVLKMLASGQDTSGICKKERGEKSLSHQHTLSKDIYKFEDAEAELKRICEYICRKLRIKKLISGGISLSLRYENLKYKSNYKKFVNHTNSEKEILKAGLVILEELFIAKSDFKIRAFGIAVFDLIPETNGINLNLFENISKIPYKVLDSLKSKYGDKIIRIGIDI